MPTKVAAYHEGLILIDKGLRERCVGYGFNWDAPLIELIVAGRWVCHKTSKLS